MTHDDTPEPGPLPPGAVPAYRLKDASKVLRGVDERTLMRWCRSGFVNPMPRQVEGGKYWLTAAEVDRIARTLLNITPDWEAGM